MCKIMALAMTAAMVVPMAAQTTAFAADDKEITYWNIAVESPDKDIVTAAVDKFNKETKSGYTVNQVAIQNDTYKEKLVIAMSSGECPDMYSSWSGGPMYEYIDSGFAQPIDDLLDQSDIKDKLLDAAIEQGSYKGHVYAIPYMNVVLAGIFYNKDMFKQYGLEEPKTLADLENICATLKENGITPFALANASKWTGSMYFMSLAARYGGLEPFQNAVAGTGKFTDDCFIKAGEKIQEWVNNGYFPDGVNSLSEDDGQAKQLMYQETAGMLLCGSWYTGMSTTSCWRHTTMWPTSSNRTLGNIGKGAVFISERGRERIRQRSLCQLLGRQQNHPVIHRHRSRPGNILIINIMAHPGIRRGGMAGFIPGKRRNQDAGRSQKAQNDAGCRLVYHRADFISNEPYLQSQDGQTSVSGNFSVHNSRAARMSSAEARPESSQTSGTPCGKKGSRRSNGTPPPSRGTWWSRDGQAV